jgi:hypothetical protein
VERIPWGAAVRRAQLSSMNSTDVQRRDKPFQSWAAQWRAMRVNSATLNDAQNQNNARV